MTDVAEPKPISRRMERFCHEFLVDMNRTAAYARAFGAIKSAYQQGSRLMKDPRILARVNELMREREESTRVKGFKVLEELAVVALSSIDHYEIDANGDVRAAAGAPPGAMRAISRIKKRVTSTFNARNELVSITETEFSLWDKNPAVTNALKHLGLLKEIVEHRDLTLEDILREAAGKSIDTPETTDARDGLETK
jgi:phage terminase small subunit